MIFVDTLEDNPRNPAPGSFRHACQVVRGARIVVFRTGGTIRLKEAVVIR